jgi:hypothetical protein
MVIQFVGGDDEARPGLAKFTALGWIEHDEMDGATRKERAGY